MPPLFSPAALGSDAAEAIGSAGDRDPVVAGPRRDEAARPESPKAPPLPVAFGRSLTAARPSAWAPRSVLIGAALALALPCSIDAQSVPAFSGRYRFVLTVSPSCPASMQVGPLSIVMNVAEAGVSAGSEVSGLPASASATPDNGRFVLLRQGNRLQGPFGASTLELGLDSEGLYRIWMAIMTDGTAATASGGRARASGTAFGMVELSLASDPTGAPIPNGNCGVATTGHQWSLEPA